MEASPIQVFIRPVAHGRVLTIEMTAKNASNYDAYLEKLFLDEELEAPVFRIKEVTSGELIEYVGMMVKRAELTIEDYLKLAPGQEVSHKINIEGFYAFPDRIAEYEIQYGATDVNPVTHKLTQRRSNIARVIFPESGK